MIIHWINTDVQIKQSHDDLQLQAAFIDYFWPLGGSTTDKKKGQLDDNRWFSHHKYIWDKIWFVLVVFSVSVEFRRVYVMIFKPGQLLLSRRRTSAVDLQVSADNSTFIDSLQMRRRQELVIKVIKYKDLVLY